MKCRIYLCRNSPPFAIIRELATATNIDRTHLVDGPGRLHLQVSSAEGQSFEGLLANALDGSPLSPDQIKEGVALIDFSTEGVQPYLWFVQLAKFESQSGYVDLEAVEWRQLLKSRIIPPNVDVASHMAAVIAGDALRSVNSFNPTHISADAGGSGGGRPLASGLKVANKDADSAFNELAQASDSEWWVDYGITWRSCRPRLKWAYRRGRDLRGAVELTEGVHLNAVTYSRDAREVPRTIRFLEASVGKNATVTASAGGQHSGSALSGIGTVQAASEADRRRVSHVQFGPTMQADLLGVLPAAEDEYVLLGAALRQLQSPIIAFQSIELSVRVPPELFANNDLSPYEVPAARPLWGAIDVGDVIMARLSSPQFFAGIDLDVRVRGIHPDEASGEMLLTVAVFG